jgi:N-acetylmuramoyl-L-alanine amidase
LILLDPARGGAETGGRIADRTDEKQVTLPMATRLASLLRARGFAVELTREADTDTSNDARAALANTTHPIACILLHAAATGIGVHLYTTSLQQTNSNPSQPALWDAAQSAYADRSHAMGSDLATAFGRSKLPVSAGTTWMRPLDNMQCPAVAVELSRLKDGTGPEDPTYEGRVAEVIAGAMLSWRGRAAAMTPAPPPPPAPKPVTEATPKTTTSTNPSTMPSGTGTIVRPSATPSTQAIPKPASTPSGQSAPRPASIPTTQASPSPVTPKPVTPKPVVPRPVAPVGNEQ